MKKAKLFFLFDNPRPIPYTEIENPYHPDKGDAIMYTVLIADDEQNIREGLKCIVDWNALGFQICGETANGGDTLRFILNENPDLVLLDIRMPKMYGTEIIRSAREHGYTGEFIILSGYSDFAYAQTAIRYGAGCYLTKPIDEDELEAAVTEAAAGLDEERSRSENIALLKSRAKDVVLRELLTGSHSGPPAEIGDMNLSADTYQVVIYERPQDIPDGTDCSFAGLLKVTNKGNMTFDSIRDGETETILLKGGFALGKFRDFLAECEQEPPNTHTLWESAFLSYGRPVDSPEDIRISYGEALCLQKRRFFCMQGQRTLGFHELPNLTAAPALDHAVLQEYCRKLTDYLLSFNRGMVAETLFSLEELLCRTDDIDSVRLFLTDLYLSVKENINLTYATAQLPFPANADAISHIGGCRHLYDIIRYISETTEKIITATGTPSRSTVLDDILYYIDHNYRHNMKLESIAPLFGYNSAYLGKIFSRHFGENFNSYVDRKRIGHSKELLREKNLKVYEIAEAVGYKNVDYFHKKFKKYVGMSPAEYRKSLERPEDVH